MSEKDFNREILKVYFIAGSQDTDGPDQLKCILEAALKAGITCYQFREKGPKSLTGIEKEKLAVDLQTLCKSFNVPFIVNDDTELAKKIEADGIHLGQEDAKIPEIIHDFEDKIIGLSVGNFKEYDESDLTHVDYIGVGPVYETSSKSDAKKPGGIELIRKMRLYDKYIPIVAIGGITHTNSEVVIKAGADGISTISSITQADNIDEVVKTYLNFYQS